MDASSILGRPISWYHDSMPDTTDPHRELHKALADIATGNMARIDKGRRAALKLLKKGVDPNGLIDGHSPLARLFKINADDYEGLQKDSIEQSRKTIIRREIVLFEVAKALVDRGADPWSGDTNVWKTWRYNYHGPAPLIQALAEREIDTGIPVRGPGGQTPLHALIVQYALPQNYPGIAWRDADEPSNQVIMSWGRVMDDAGNLPVHTLWESALGVHSHDREPFIDYALRFQEDISGAIAAEGGGWRTLSGTPDPEVALRGSLMIENRDGVCVADMMLHPAIKQLLEDWDTIDRTGWVQTIEHTLMTRKTPSAKGRIVRVRL